VHVGLELASIRGHRILRDTSISGVLLDPCRCMAREESNL
jgi:hypothetical protein